MYVLAKFSERYDASSYGSLVRRALGKKTAAGLSAVMLLYLWGSCVAYLVREGAWYWVCMSGTCSTVTCTEPASSHFIG